MSWTPIIETDTGNKSESEQLKEFEELVFRKTLLNSLEEVICQLRLLNARFEEAFDTGIDELDV